MANSTRDIGAEQLGYDPAYDDDREAARQFDLQYYLSVLRKNKWPIVLFTAVVTALAGYYAFTAQPIYSATSTLQIESQKASLVSVEDFIGAEQENDDYYQTQFEILRSRRLANRIVGELELWRLPQFQSTGAERGVGDLAGASPRATSDGGASMLDGLVESIRGIGAEPGSSDRRAAEPMADGPVADGSIPGGSESGLDAGSPAAFDSVVVDGGTDFERWQAGIDLESRGANLIAPVIPRYPAEDDPRTAAQFQSAVSWFMENMTVSPLRNTKLVRLSFESEDPELAAYVANAIGEQYIDSYLDSRMEMTSRASSWLNDRLGVLKAELDDAEERLIAYKRENGLVDVNGSVGRLNEQELLLATEELAQARSELSSAADIYREVREYRDRPELLESIVAIQSDPLIQQVLTEQGQRQRELDELLNRYGERHPRVVDAKSRLASLETTMAGHVERVISSIEKEYQLLRQQVASIESKLSQGKQEILVLGTKRFELEELEREVDTKRGLYNTFYSRITEAKSADGLETANARIADLAVVPRAPIKPRKQLIIALAALSSLLLACMLALLFEQMDTTVKGADDIEKKLGLRLLGILPLVKSGLLKNGSSKLPLNPINLADKKGTFFESVNTIRTALSVSENEAVKKVIVVTSSVPGEGKSTVSMNLAYSHAQLERVLLIDCDMRRPAVAKTAGLDRNAPGLTDLIMRNATLGQCIRKGVFDDYVDVITSGSVCEQPLELLSSRRFQRIVEHLASHYDRIIIDSAPAQAVSDALVLSKLADGVIYAVKSHDTDMSLVGRGIERLRQVNAPLVGVVITQVDVDKLASYGGDYYYQGYYDYYGYNTKNDDSRGKIRLSREEMHDIRNDVGSLDDDEFDDREMLPEPAVPARGSNRPIDPIMESVSQDSSRERRDSSRERRFSDDLDIL